MPLYSRVQSSFFLPLSTLYAGVWMINNKEKCVRFILLLFIFSTYKADHVQDAIFDWMRAVNGELEC